MVCKFQNKGSGEQVIELSRFEIQHGPVYSSGALETLISLDLEPAPDRGKVAYFVVLPYYQLIFTVNLICSWTPSVEKGLQVLGRPF